MTGGGYTNTGKTNNALAPNESTLVHNAQFDHCITDCMSQYKYMRLV